MVAGIKILNFIVFLRLQAQKMFFFIANLSNRQAGALSFVSR